MTATSAASTLGDSWNRLSEHNAQLEPLAMPSGSRLAPPALGTAYLPHGKVLVAVDDAVTALDLQRVLSGAGFRIVGPASAATDIQRLIQRGDIDCAILDLDVDRRAPLPIADLLAFAEVPLVYLTAGDPGLLPARHRHRPIVENPFGSARLLAAVDTAMARSRESARHGSALPLPRVYPQL